MQTTTAAAAAEFILWRDDVDWWWIACLSGRLSFCRGVCHGNTYYAFVVLLANPHVIGGSLRAGTESADRMEEKVGVHEKNIRPTGDTEY